MEFDFSQGPYSGMSTPRAEFPQVYDYEAARDAMWLLAESELLLGVDGESSPMTADLSSDSPHILISAASGAGKSVTARSIAMQGLIKGYTVIFLDAKRHSHRWAKNLPQVHYACTMPEIANAITSVAVELHRRNEVVERWPGSIDTAPVGPRIMIVFEEMNATMDSLADLDKQLSKGSYTTTAGFGDIMFLGRAARINVVAIGQKVDHTVMKSAIRENFGVRILIAHTWETWASLVPRSSAGNGQPAAPTAVGRGYVVIKGKPRETQLMFVDEETAAELVRVAHSGRVRSGQQDPALTQGPFRQRRQTRQAVRAARRATGRRLTP